MALTQQELEGRLWAAANSLRGPVDPADVTAEARLRAIPDDLPGG